ncbi:MAG: NAD-dependent epimerase/dehydratase family protein [Nostocoides sp.]
MRVLLTGHHGYIGAVLGADLVSAGHDVVGLDTGYFTDRLLGPPPPALPTMTMDLRDVQASDLEGFDAVVHLAALSNDPLGSLAPEVTYEINHRASVLLAQAAKQASVGRFLYASTCSVYGASGGQHLLDEHAPLAPVTPYARSKVQVEADLSRLADETFSPTYLRNATAFGFSPRLRADIVLNNLVGYALLTGEVRVLSDGTPWRPLVHVRDISAAFVALLAAPKDVVHDEAFNIGTEMNNVTVADIAEVVHTCVPGSTTRITGESGGDPRSYRVDFSKLRARVPGFQARWGVEAGAEELVDAYRRFCLTTAQFSRDFVRLAALQDHIAAGRLDEATLRWR